MNPNPLLDILKDLPEYNRLQELLSEGKGPVAALGLPDAQRAHVFAALTRGRSGLLLAANEQAAEELYAQARAMGDHVALLPPREMPLVNAYAASGEHAKTRIATLVRLALGESVGLVASPEALLQLLAPPDVLRRAVHTLRRGDTIPPRELFFALCEAGYEPVDLVEGPGQASLRGDILDIYPPHAQQPVRAEFFDDEVDRLSVYDAQTQRSISNIDEALLPPATEAPQEQAAKARALAATEGAKGFDAQRAAFADNRACPGAEILLPVLYEERHSLFDYLPRGVWLFVEEPHRVQETAESAERLFNGSVAAMLARGEGIPEQVALQMTAAELLENLRTPRTALLQSYARPYMRIRALDTVQFDARPAPRYTGEISELARDIRMSIQTDSGTQGSVLLYAGAHAKQIHQQLLEMGLEAGLAQALKRQPARGELLILEDSLPRGLAYAGLQLTVLTETELFGHTRRESRKKHSSKPRLLFSELKRGDYIVHEAHGIGHFIGVEALTVQDNTRDYLLMEYAGGDRLYIPTDQLDRVQKYIGGEEEPRLSKLGGNEWQRQVSRARHAVKELAIDLAKLYAERQNSRGFAFSKDSKWQIELEEKFPYQETQDQAQSIADIKRDMESARVMDRLLCGDVGYGKTEVALRAAFKAVQDSKQVALLVPTTILAQQHYNTFSARFAGFPVRVALLSRFKSAQEQKETKRLLAEGRVDVVIGTHALLGKEVKFLDLGLLIIDEEQRFGVGHKEQIKAIKANVDVLTLTATPIPRTLHMSMIGIRDMSVIDTPPEGRFPVETFVLEYSDTLLRDVLRKELNRGGQCYVVYNQVSKMERMLEKLRMLLPDANVAYAHGQMPETQLEQVMMDFLNGHYDILLCSTIIENGLDIGNVNTLFVLEADKMGLSQLYQLRGRVGRTARLGYAYFTFERDRAISEVAHKRLTALTEFAQFGAGREIALRDLEIRGAGSLLGAMQHGHIADIGYEYYCKLMASAVRQARNEEAPILELDPVIDVPINANIPKGYIPGEVQRLSMYKRIALITDGANMMDVQEELFDRYGEIPPETQNLMDIALIKALCAAAHVATLSVGPGHAKLIYHAQARPDGGKLLAVASEYQLQLTPGEVVSAVYRREGMDARAMLQTLFPLLEALKNCV